MGEDVATTLFEQIKRRKEALKLSESLFLVSKGEELDVAPQLESFLKGKVDHHDGPRRVTTKLSELIENTYKRQGFRWRLSCLNKSLGSLRPGDFGFLFARPETGKTTFLASELSNFLEQVDDRPIIWLNNEEDGDKVMLRVYQAYFGVPLAVLLGNIERFERAFEQQTKGLFQMYDDATMSKRVIEKLVEEQDPCVVVYDQIDKIKGFAADREDLRLGSIYQWGRELAKHRHAAIGVCQADGTAEGVRYLTMEHVANAKTAKQAEADWILGIGKIHDEHQQYVRYLNISKNKLFGDEDSIAELKHGKFETIINPGIARYEDIVDY